LKSALIFGGSGAIGNACEKILGHLGYEVLIADKKQSDKKDNFIICDTTKESDVTRAIQSCQSKFGQIDVVLCCQGEYLVKRFEKTTEDEFEKIINTNLKSVFLVCKNVVPLLKWQGFGYIINLASMAGLRANRGHGAYCASKFGVIGLTETLYEELQGTGVRVTAVCPSSVDTPFVKNELKLSTRELEKLLKPNDVARVIAELVSSNPRVLRKIVPIEIDLELDKLERKERYS